MGLFQEAGHIKTAASVTSNGWAPHQSVEGCYLKEECEKITTFPISTFGNRSQGSINSIEALNHWCTPESLFLTNLHYYLHALMMTAGAP